MAANPEAVSFKFIPITSLLNGIPGSGYLSHAINLYLRCKVTEFLVSFSCINFLSSPYPRNISACFCATGLAIP